MTPTLTATLSPLTLWKFDLSLPWTSLWITSLICRSAREEAGALRLAIEWRSRL